ncbi:MAG: bifunctional adenosylcobinamide kinase/adenosylcobinamide-phosphate guanylyltransferase [Moraxella sp.]|nr:bifunctional adenosylcobinamide kinase/adenosylcobinamide-phosphate guanylyltransferase [Moraxella sp.]
MIYLVLGGARSGKSRHAQTLATDLSKGDSVCYIATAQALDDEMADRIHRHQCDRPAHWHTQETTTALADSIARCMDTHRVILVDCLTLWLNNLLLADDKVMADELDKFISLIQTLPPTCELILVSNETGLGVVPMGQLTRRFVDESGFLHQNVASCADKVVFCVAGLPMTLKG